MDKGNYTGMVMIDLQKAFDTVDHEILLKVIYRPLYSMNKFVTNKSKLPQDGAQVFPYMG